MKKLYLIGGTMGVGKTTTCQILKKKLDRAVFLDGDWCWDADPFCVTTETKALVLDNICHILNNFIKCSAYENIIFCWVMHQQDIIDDILSRLDFGSCETRCISLICSKEALAARLKADIENGLRGSEIIERSTLRLPLYSEINSVTLDVSDITPEEAADIIIRL